VSRRVPARTRRNAVPRWLRIVLIVVVIAVTVVVLFTTVFPWVERQLEDPTMGVVQVVRSPR
jgi:cell division septal protein FtsQ